MQLPLGGVWRPDPYPTPDLGASGLRGDGGQTPSPHQTPCGVEGRLRGGAELDGSTAER